MTGEIESEGEYDSFVSVPDRIDAITASGLVEMHKALNELDTARLESLPIEQQGVMLWKMVEKGVIDVGLTEGSKR